MVVYTCGTCEKPFSKKYQYERHLNKIKQCHPPNNNMKMELEEFDCKICNKKFNRVDVLKRHYESEKHKTNMKAYKKKDKNVYNLKKVNANRDITIGNNNNNNGNINSNNNNYYFISPFGKEEITKLSIAEKMSTLLSKDNPIVEIILVTNLNPDKPEYHNIGYTDLKSGYGVIFNGKTWEKKEINGMINELLMTKKNDLYKIRIEISSFLSEEHKKIIEDKLQNVDDNVEPKLEHQVRSKKKLITNLKTHFVNGRSLVQDAIKNTGAPIDEIKYKKQDSWMDEYDFPYMEKQIKLINAKKDLAKDILKHIDHLDHKAILTIIDIAQTSDEISVINRLLIRSLVEKNDINTEIIKQQLKKDEEMNDLLRD